MPRNFDEDILAAEQQAIIVAFRLVMDLLFCFGNDGDECIQALVAAKSDLAAQGTVMAQLEVFRAFHHGFVTQDRLGSTQALPLWSANAGLQRAYETGGRAARHNAHFRERNLGQGWNVAPFDTPGACEIFERALAAATASSERIAANR